MKPHPYRGEEFVRQANSAPGESRAQKSQDSPLTFFEQCLIDRLDSIIRLLENAQRTKSISDLIKK